MRLRWLGCGSAYFRSLSLASMAAARFSSMEGIIFFQRTSALAGTPFSFPLHFSLYSVLFLSRGSFSCSYFTVRSVANRCAARCKSSLRGFRRCSCYNCHKLSLPFQLSARSLLSWSSSQLHPSLIPVPRLFNLLWPLTWLLQNVPAWRQMPLRTTSAPS